MMDSARLKWHLENWARWMHSGGLREFHVAAKSVGIGFTHYDTESSYDKSDRSYARATDAAVADLKPLERAAMHCEYLGAMWRNPVDIAPILVIAHEAVRMGLNRRGII